VYNDKKGVLIVEILSSISLGNSGKAFLLEKRIKLLQAIKEEGSILKAAKKVPISYKAAWEAVDEMNNLCPTPLVVKESGGKGGGGTTLTPYGERIIELFLLIEAEQKRFLERVAEVSDFTTAELNTIQRIAMQLSARNQLGGIIEEMTIGKVNAEVVIKLKSGNLLVSNITKHGVENMGLKKGDEVVAIFKSSSVLVGLGDTNISARNKISGEVSGITHGEVSCEVVIDTGCDEKVTSVITNHAAEDLGLEVGKKVVAIIKSTEIMIGR